MFNEPWLRHAVLVWFIDNLGVVSALCKGPSVVYDLGCVIHVLRMMCATRKLATWWGHVDSRATVADMGMRNDVAFYASVGIAMRPAPLPEWPSSGFDQPASYWLSWLQV